jgi:hypothetical protein
MGAKLLFFWENKHQWPRLFVLSTMFVVKYRKKVHNKAIFVLYLTIGDGYFVFILAKFL